MGLYDRILDTIKPYFPNTQAATQFLEMQCELFIQTNPAKLLPTDLGKLADSASISSKLVMDNDKSLEMSQKILEVYASMSA